MSLTIYNGVKFNVSTFQELNDKLILAKENLSLVLAEDLFRMAANKASKSDQTFFLALLDLEGFFMSNELSQIPYHDFEIGVFVFENKFYGHPITTLSRTKETFLNQDFVDYYGYWDNVDSDEDCSEEEWEERGRVWSSIMDSNNGHTFGQIGYYRKLIKYTEFRIQAQYTNKYDSLITQLCNEHNIEVPEFSKYPRIKK